MSSTTLIDSPRLRVPLGSLAIPVLAAAAAVCISLAATQDWERGLFVASALAAVGAICFRPPVATSICLFLLYINAPAVAVKFHGVPPVVAAATVGLLLIPVIYYVAWKREPFYVDAVLPWLLAFSGVQFASALLADDRTLAMEALIVFLMEGLLLFLLASNAIRNTNVTWALIAAGVFMGALGVFQKVTGTYWNDYQGFAQVTEPNWNWLGEMEGGTWPAGPIGDKNYYAQFMLMLLPFAMARFWYEPSRKLRLLGLVSAMFIFAGMGLSGSRGAVIGLAAMVVIMFLLGYAKMRHLVGLGTVITAIVLLMPQYRERVVSILDVANVLGTRDLRQADTSVQGRLTEMYAAAIVSLEHPLLGVGPGNFPAHFVDKAGHLGFAVHGVERRAHCLYLEIAAEMGIPGLFCLAMILAIIIRNLLRAHAMAPTLRLQGMAAAALLALVAMLVTGIFLSLAYIRYFWLILALCAAISRMIFQEAQALESGPEERPQLQAAEVS